MRNVFVFSLVILAMAVLSAACGHNPVGPTTPTTPPDPDPDQSGYEVLPAMHRLLAADGTPTHMWATLNSVSPKRGSVISFNPPAPGKGCENSCFRMEIVLGLDTLPNPNSGALLEVWFSDDSVNLTRHVWGQLVYEGTSVDSAVGMGNSFLVFSGSKPQYLVVKGSFRGDVNGSFGTFPGESGTTSFVLDYK